MEALMDVQVLRFPEFEITFLAAGSYVCVKSPKQIVTTNPNLVISTCAAWNFLQKLKS